MRDRDSSLALTTLLGLILLPPTGVEGKWEVRGSLPCLHNPTAGNWQGWLFYSHAFAARSTETPTSRVLLCCPGKVQGLLSLRAAGSEEQESWLGLLCRQGGDTLFFGTSPYMASGRSASGFMRVELTMSLTSCDTLEIEPCTSAGEQGRDGPGCGVGW